MRLLPNRHMSSTFAGEQKGEVDIASSLPPRLREVSPFPGPPRPPPEVPCRCRCGCNPPSRFLREQARSQTVATMRRAEEIYRQRLITCRCKRCGPTMRCVDGAFKRSCLKTLRPNLCEPLANVVATNPTYCSDCSTHCFPGTPGDQTRRYQEEEHHRSPSPDPDRSEGSAMRSSHLRSREDMRHVSFVTRTRSLMYRTSTVDSNDNLCLEAVLRDTDATHVAGGQWCNVGPFAPIGCHMARPWDYPDIAHGRGALIAYARMISPPTNGVNFHWTDHALIDLALPIFLDYDGSMFSYRLAGYALAFSSRRVFPLPLHPTQDSSRIWPCPLNIWSIDDPDTRAYAARQQMLWNAMWHILHSNISSFASPGCFSTKAPALAVSQSCACLMFEHFQYDQVCQDNWNRLGITLTATLLVLWSDICRQCLKQLLLHGLCCEMAGSISCASPSPRFVGHISKSSAKSTTTKLN